MAVSTFIPEVWSARLLYNLQKSQVFGQPGVVNRDYEGDIAQVGDTVRIQAIGAVTITPYVKNVDLSSPETLTDAETTLAIDQSQSFNFQVDDVDRRQIRVDLIDAAMREAAYGLSDTADQLIAGFYASSGSAVASSGSPKTDMATATNAYIHLVELAIELDKMNVPSAGRWVIVPPWYHGKLLQDARFVANGTDSGAATLANGQVGEAAGFRVIKSNNVSTDATTWRIMAGTSQAISFAEQIKSVEAYRPEKRFADAVKGLHLYGAKVIRPAALSTLYVNIA
jgi:N4-gp56 family major capsid protein